MGGKREGGGRGATAPAGVALFVVARTPRGALVPLPTLAAAAVFVVVVPLAALADGTCTDTACFAAWGPAAGGALACMQYSNSRKGPQCTQCLVN